MGRSGDTIFALSSGAGRAAVAVLRLSGPASAAIVKAVCGRLPAPRRAVLADFQNPASGERIDRGLVIFFEGPASFTGEDGAELHAHGGRAVVAALIEALSACPGMRAAEAGEFSRRALMNGKLDLAQIEGLGDLVAAETERQRRQALRQTEGALGRETAGWRAALLEAAARIEARIDFSDEGEVAAAPELELAGLLSPVVAALDAELKAAKAGERLREGLVIVVAGPPNAGKSTLVNALARRDVAIVSEEAGTTRDAIEVALDLGGYAVTLIDTAGLRETGDRVERIGVARALERAARADLTLWLSEAAAPTPPDARLQGPVWRVLTKADLAPQPWPVDADLALSAATGGNLDSLLQRLTRFAEEASGDGREGLITRERHRRAVADAAHALRPLLEGPALPEEIAAEHVRQALFALERLIGRVDVEDVLGDIFSRFCIGK
ncbi:tRNA uridine-5-carboxymethylaminomethyl(34) synthesis GTPase MnmE [Methylocella sp.]|uniref:tRNA uridine-5-carboxymethylaminomethyl(34) synthesis GTPase MnmE n=1 Tax=Methylocella sp. TaxID=1978226 RepID=UPI003784D0DC